MTSTAKERDRQALQEELITIEAELDEAIDEGAHKDVLDSMFNKLVVARRKLFVKAEA